MSFFHKNLKESKVCFRSRYKFLRHIISPFNLRIVLAIAPEIEKICPLRRKIRCSYVQHQETARGKNKRQFWISYDNPEFDIGLLHKSDYK